MKKVKIAEFKSKLSSYLRRVRKGEPILILDREQPIAQVIPIPSPERKPIQLVPPKKKGNWKALQFRPSPSYVDIVKMLREDRDSR